MTFLIDLSFHLLMSGKSEKNSSLFPKVKSLHIHSFVLFVQQAKTRTHSVNDHVDLKKVSNPNIECVIVKKYN